MPLISWWLVALVDAAAVVAYPPCVARFAWLDSEQRRAWLVSNPWWLA